MHSLQPQVAAPDSDRAKAVSEVPLETVEQGPRAQDPARPAGDKTRVAECFRSAFDIQRAHDLIVGIILDVQLRRLLLRKFTNQTSAFEQLKAYADTLCWILGHDHNQTFAENLASIEHGITALGYEVHDSGSLRAGEERP